MLKIHLFPIRYGNDPFWDTTEFEFNDCDQRVRHEVIAKSELKVRQHQDQITKDINEMLMELNHA